MLDHGIVGDDGNGNFYVSCEYIYDLISIVELTVRSRPTAQT